MLSPGGAVRKSILVISATAGAGHLRAGEALAAAAESMPDPPAISHSDILECTTPLFRALYSKTYYAVVSSSPELWGYLYDRSDRAGRPRGKAPLLKLFDPFNFKKYLRRLEELNPDAVVCPHFLPYLAIEDKILARNWKIPFYSEPTDYAVHSLWVSRAVRRFYAATEEAAWSIRSHGIPKGRISVSGIPVMPAFVHSTDRAAAAKRLGLSPSLSTVLILSGGYGVGIVDTLVPSVSGFLAGKKPKRFQLIVVCGKNPGLHARLSRIKYPPNVEVTLYKFIPFVDAVMACSDVLITKAGGLTVSEALASNLPMVILDPFPGQEGRNADYVVEEGAATFAAGFSNLHYKLDTLIGDPPRLQAMRRRARAIAKPNAARDILDDVLRSIS